MTLAEILDLYEYNRWAHERCLESVIDLSSQQYGEKLVGSFPSLRATLEHLLATEVVWLSRWEGHSLGDAPDYGGCKDVTSLKSLWNSFWNRQRSFLEALSEEDLSQLVAIRTRVCKVSFDLGGRWRKADYVEICSSETFFRRSFL